MKSVVVCGSKRYNKEIGKFCNQLEAAGLLVFEPNIAEATPEDSFIHSDKITKIVFKGLTLEHFDWIRKADVCFVYNKGGYVGISVTMEMACASALGKPIIALESKTGDPCRDALIDKVVKTPKQLITLIK